MSAAKKLLKDFLTLNRQDFLIIASFFVSFIVVKEAQLTYALELKYTQISIFYIFCKYI